MRAPAAVRPSGSASAVRLWVRRDARRRIRSLAVLSVLVAVAGGVVLAAVAGGRRNGTTTDRLLLVTRPADALVLPNLPDFDWDAVRRFPEVESVGEFAVTLWTIDGVDPTGQRTQFPPASPELATTMERPVVVSGRRADPARVDEIVIGPAVAGTVAVGDRLTVRLPSAQQVSDYMAGGPEPDRWDGPTQDVTVVGVVKGAFFAGDGYTLTHAFFERYRASLAAPGVSINALVLLRGGQADIPLLRQHLDALAGRSIEVQSTLDSIDRVRSATDLERTALDAFALAAAAASLVLVGQALLRVVAAPGGELPMLRALGFTRRERLFAVAAAPIAATLAGALVALPVAYALSDRFPIGVGRQFEPTPGYQFDGRVLGPGFAVLAAVGLAGCVVLARRQLGRSVDAPVRVRTSYLAGAIARTGAPVPVALGTRLALERGRGSSAVPVRPALVGAVVGILGIVGSLTFRDGLARAADDRGLFGQNYDAQVGIYGPVPPGSVDLATFLPADPDTEMVEEVRNGELLVNGTSVSAFGIRPLEGDYGLRPLAGRLPERDDEISVAPKDMRRLGLAIGDVVEVGEAGIEMRVVGETFTPELGHTPYDQGVRLTDAGLRRFVPADDQLKFHSYLLGFGAGVDAAAAGDRLQESIPFATVFPAAHRTEDQLYLTGVRRVPLWLGVFLALLATGAVGHALASAVRRRRHDVAVLRVLGLTRRQARASVAWQATTLALVGLVIGIPLGIALGRTVWRQVADTKPMLYVPPAAALAAVLAAPAAIALANALAAWPGRIAARTRPAEILRVE